MSAAAGRGPRYLAPSNTYDRSAIMRSAWFKARHEVIVSAKPCWPFPARPTTLRAAFGRCLREVWALARSERAYALWAAAFDANAAAEAARRAALPTRDRDIEDARYALMLAEHNDTHVGHRLVSDARARLSSLQHAA